MDLDAEVDRIASRRDLTDFIEKLRDDLQKNPDDWENPSLERFLEAMAAWVEAMDQCYRNQGLEFSEDQSWKTFATILLAARTYE
jgi:hypothetical protein